MNTMTLDIRSDKISLAFMAPRGSPFPCAMPS